MAPHPSSLRPFLAGCASIAAVTLTFAACGGSPAPAEAPAETPSEKPTAEAVPPAAEEASPDLSSYMDDGSDGSTAAPASSAGPGAEPREETTKKTSKRSNEEITAVITQHRPKVRKCYDDAFAKDPTLPAGDMTITFYTDPEGVVKKVELNAERSQVTAPAVVDCALAILKELKFAPHEGGMESKFNYPFNFKHKR